MTSTSVDLSRFREIHPAPPTPQYRLTVAADKKHIRCGQKFFDQLRHKCVRLFVDEDAESIVLMESAQEDGFAFRTNLSARAPAFAEAILSEGITLPVQYDLHYVEEQGIWLGTRLSSQRAPKSIDSSSVPKKPRKKGLSAMAEEAP